MTEYPKGNPEDIELDTESKVFIIWTLVNLFVISFGFFGWLAYNWQYWNVEFDDLAAVIGMGGVLSSVAELVALGLIVTSPYPY